MKVITTRIPEVLVLEPTVFPDNRGFFFESYNSRSFQEATGLTVDFVQDNYSHSRRNVLRGLHYQIQRPQGKLIRALSGEIFDVAVDLRRSSDTFGVWFGVALTSENKRALWIPEGFGHGFLVLSEAADVLYKTTDYWFPEHERTLLWNDPNFHINWPVSSTPILSTKDSLGHALERAELFR